MNIPRFNPGQGLTAADLNKLGDAIRANRITGFVGGRVEINASGTSLIANQSGSSGGGEVTLPTTPFQILQAPPQTGDQPGRVYVYVDGQSFLMANQNEHDFVSINNISTGYHRFLLPPLYDVFVVLVEFYQTMDIKSATFYPENLANIPLYPAPIQRDDTAEGVYYLRQKFLWIPIAEVVDTTDPREGTVYTDDGIQKKVVQLVSTDLMMTWEIVDGMAGIIARPWNRRAALFNA